MKTRNVVSSRTAKRSSQSRLSFFPPGNFLWRLISMPHFIIIQESALDFLPKYNTNS